MTAVGRYVLLTLRLFVRQWSAQGLLVGGGSLLMLFLTRDLALWRWQPELLFVVGFFGYAFGRSLRGKCAVPDRTVGLVGFPLPITPRARWMGGLIASGLIGLVLFGSLRALGLLFGTRHGEGGVRPLIVDMLVYLPWAGVAFLGREGLGVGVMFRVLVAVTVWLAALRWLTPDVMVLGLWSAVVVAGSFLAAPRWERLDSSLPPETPGKRAVPGLGAPPLSPFLAWSRVLTTRPLIGVVLASMVTLVLFCVGLAYVTHPDEPGRLIMSSYLVIAVGHGIGLPIAVRSPFRPLAPATLLPLPARSLWWATLLASIPVSMLMVGAWMTGMLLATFALGEPIDPALYATMLTKAPLVITGFLFIRASWQLGFLLPLIPRGVFILLAFAACVTSAFPPEWGPSLVQSSIAFAGSVGLLAALAPRHYRAPV